MLENLGVLAALGAMLCWGFGDFFIQRTTRRLGDIEALFFIGLFGAIVLFPFIYGELPFVFSDFNILAALFFLGFSAFVVSIVNFQALKEGKLSIVEPIIELELPLTIIFAFLLFSESLTSVQLALTAVVFLGIVLISISKFNFKTKHLLEKGVLLAMITAAGFGFINIFTATMARQTSPLLAIWSAWTVIALFCLACLLRKKGLTGLANDAKQWRGLLLAESVLDTVAWALFAIAVVELPVALATAITESYPAIGILLGILVNKELVKNHQFAGMGLTLFACIGLTLMA